MELKDTVELMNSQDYKERFKAEYWQLKIRYQKLHNVVIKYEAKTLDFAPTCDLDLLKHQMFLMEQLLYVLEVRAEIEKVNLEEK